MNTRMLGQFIEWTVCYMGIMLGSMMCSHVLLDLLMGLLHDDEGVFALKMKYPVTLLTFYS